VSETPDVGWGGAIVVIGEQSESAWALCRAIRKGDLPVEPLLLLIGGNRLDELDLRDELYDDFCLDPFHPRELEARLRHLFWRTGTGAAPELVEHGGLVLNLETYQAQIEGRSSPARRCCRGSGATSTTAARGPWTSTSGGCGPSWARSTPT
jgi:DNA-binding response OmpR family regulator